MSENDETALTTIDDESDDRIIVAEATGLASITKSEVEAQLDAAHRYPRSVTKFQKDALTMATINADTAQSCIYALPRGGKSIAGPSVRLAEICASAWKNLHIAARIVGIEDTVIVAQGGAWDLEKNTRYTVETRRRITDKNGRRFNDDMITVTGNAAASIALRNAIFRAIPRAYVDQIYVQVRKVAIGDASTLATRRAAVLERLGKMGADQARVLAALEVKGVEDIGLEQLEILIGYGTAIKDGTKSVDDIFPGPVRPDVGEEQGRRISLGARGASKPEKKADKDKEPEKPDREPGMEG